MTVLVANDTPPAVRGLLKRWFIEPRPNVFVGSVNRRTREKTLAYIRRNAPEMGMLMIAAAKNCQGFEVTTWGETNRRLAEFDGLQLIAEDWDGRSDGADAEPADNTSDPFLTGETPF
jgi:CRISPR-associated protein Cas2